MIAPKKLLQNVEMVGDDQLEILGHCSIGEGGGSIEALDTVQCSTLLCSSEYYREVQCRLLYSAMPYSRSIAMQLRYFFAVRRVLPCSTTEGLPGSSIEL